MPKSFNIAPTDGVKELARVGLSESSPNVSDTSNRPVVTDSRSIGKGDIFLAYSGVSFDAHTVVKDIAKKQPSLIIHEKEIPQLDVPTLKVKSARAAWAQLASYAYGHPQQSMRMIAVTGTNGKTSTVHFIRELLGETSASIGTVGAYIGPNVYETKHTTPDPPELFHFLSEAKKAGMTHVAMEASSHALVQNKLFPIRFSAAVFTSFARDHLDLHGSMQEYWDAKKLLFTDLLKDDAPAIICTGVKQGKALAEELPNEVIFYGGEGAKLGSIEYASAGNIMPIEYQKKSYNIKTSIVGKFAFENLLAGLLAVRVTTESDDFPTDLRHLRAPRGRLELANEAESAPQVFVDYAHTPDAIKEALSALKPACKGKLWIVFGCGGDRDKGKRPEMAEAAMGLADKVVITTDNPRTEEPAAIIKDIEAGLKAGIDSTSIIGRKEAIEFAVSKASENDTILIAGKGHETYMEIHGKRQHFDDREQAQTALKNRSK